MAVRRRVLRISGQAVVVGAVSQAVELGCRVVARAPLLSQLCREYPSAVEFFDIGSYLNSSVIRSQPPLTRAPDGPQRHRDQPRAWRRTFQGWRGGHGSGARGQGL